MRTHSIGTLLRRGLRRRCPECGGRGWITRWFRLGPRCVDCGYKPDRQDGFMLGAMTMNIGVTLVVMVVFMFVGMIVTYPDIAAVPLTLGCVAIAVVLPLAFYPFSQTLWAAVDLAMRPLEPAEIADAIAWKAAHGGGSAATG